MSIKAFKKYANKSWIQLKQNLKVKKKKKLTHSHTKIPTNECPTYDNKKSDREAAVMLELWGMQSASLLPLFLGLLWPGVVALDWVLLMSQIGRKLCTYAKLNSLK